MVTADVAGEATEEDRAAIAADPGSWAAVLWRMLDETDEALDRSEALAPDLRRQVQPDLDGEWERIARRLRDVTGADLLTAVADERPAAAPAHPVEPGALGLHATWSGRRVVVWSGGPGVTPLAGEDLGAALAEASGGSVEWEPHPAVPLPDGAKAEARATRLTAALGWLVAVGSGQATPEAGASLRWIGTITAWATELVAQGRVVPAVRRSKRTPGQRGTSRFAVRWVPTAVDGGRLRALARRMPPAVTALDAGGDAEDVARAILEGAVDVICRTGAKRLVPPATAPIARTSAEVGESVLAGLGGEPFEAAADVASGVAESLRRWAAPATGDLVGLVLRLDPPADDGGWMLHVEVTGVDRHPLPVEHALAVASHGKGRAIEAQLHRLERLLPLVGRPGGQRRGQVILSSDEAWQLMTDNGPVLAAVGFEVKVPELSRTRPTPRLRLQADTAGPSQVGINQLCKVHWSVLFDDIELNASEIAQLATEARPLIHSGGRWVELDRADLQAAASALAERAKTRELSGAEVLRHAVGLEGSALAGSVTVDGSGWAADLLRSVQSAAVEPKAAPASFVGRLREYQAEALGWLYLLDRVGLGGCLALDMGLGKTPTVLALIAGAKEGTAPTLVITPPAVLGNWEVEAKRFTPGLRVVIHHGASRAGEDTLARVAGRANIVLTTYGTAVRDMDALAKIEWDHVVIDEAQAIKNPVSETAQALRRLQARTRLALTGTPVENGLGDLWSILDFTNPGLVGPRNAFIEQLSKVSGGAGAEGALRALGGLLVFRRTKAEPAIAAELPDKIDQLDHCSMTAEQIGLYQAILDRLLGDGLSEDKNERKGQVLAAITALKQVCDHPAAYLHDDDGVVGGRSGKLARLDEIVEAVFAAGERLLVFTHFARWGQKLATHLTARTKHPVACYHGGLSRTERDRIIAEFQAGTGPGALVLSLKAGGSGLNLTNASHVVLYDRWWNPAVEDQARDRAWRIGQTKTVVCHRLVCPGTVDERVEEVVAGKRRIADLALPASSSLADLTADQLRGALGIRDDALLDEEEDHEVGEEDAA